MIALQLTPVNSSKTRLADAHFIIVYESSAVVLLY